LNDYLFTMLFWIVIGMLFTHVWYMANGNSGVDATMRKFVFAILGMLGIGVLILFIWFVIAYILIWMNLFN
jgi:hypothetical protein